MDLGGINAAQMLNQANLGNTAKTDGNPIKVNSQVVAEPVKIPAVEETEIRPEMEQRRFAKVTEAAKRIITEFFPINDTRFTIFKDGSGQYVTRVTNMRDGTMTFYPEPTVLSRGGAGLESFYNASA